MSDRIKKIKIKQSDGTFSDYIPIGANAKDVDMANGYSLENTIGTIDVDKEGSIAKQLSKTTKYYDSVADMKADTQLTGGVAAVTLGYYKPNDGGGALYQIIDSTDEDYESLVDDGGSAHDLKNNLKAKLIIEDSVNVKQFGAKGNGIADDTEAIQLAIDLCKDVCIPAGEFLTSNLTLNKKNSIKGMGKSVSILKSVNTEDPMFLCELNSEGREEITISDISMQGNKVGKDGIKLYRTEGSSNDAWIDIHNIAIKNFKGDGLYIGGNIREVYVNTVEIAGCDNYGLFLDEGATDNVISNVCSHNNENAGFYVNGANNRFNNCKAFWNGRNNNASQENRSSGFLITSWCNKFINCDAQENALHGFCIKNTNNIQLLGITADRNGLPMTDWSSDSPEITYGSGVYIKNSSLVSVTGILRDFRKYQMGQTQKYGIYVVESKYCDFDVMIQHLEELYYIQKSSNYILKINGEYYICGATRNISDVNKNNYVKMASSEGRLGYDFYCGNAQYQIYSDNNGKFKIDTFKRNEAGDFVWSGTPIYFDNNGNIHLGRYNTKLGFYDVDGVELQTINGTANDLNSAITLVNSLKTSLINLGLIKEDY